MKEKDNGRGAKQVIVLRKDLGMNAGKATAQGSHGSIASSLTNFFRDNMQKEPDKDGNYTYTIKHNVEALHYWLLNRFVKAVVAVHSEAELIECYDKAKAKGLLCSLIQDAGFTQFDGVPTYTAVSIGPAWDDEFIGITDHLKLYR